MITEKTRYYLTINGYRALSEFRKTSRYELKDYSCCVNLRYQISDLLAGHQRGLMRHELYSLITLFPDEKIKEMLMNLRKAGHITTASSAGVKPKKGSRLR